MSELVGNPEDRFSHNKAHIIFLKKKQFFTSTVIFLGHLDTSLEKTRNEIAVYTEETLNQQKHKASEVG